MTRPDLATAVERLTRGVNHWTPTAWAATPPGSAMEPGGSAPCRADILYALVQRLADLAADAESLPRRAVPRLDNDLALPDQLRVVTADLLAADRPVPDEAVAVVRDTGGTLLR